MKPKPLEKETSEMEKDSQLDIRSIEFGNIFPVLFKYYDTHPVGSAVLRNWEPDPVSDISVNFYVEQYMDNPKRCTAPSELKGGEEAEIDLYALFTDRVLEITEGTKVSAKITLEYTLQDKRYSTEHVETLRLYNRNAITWDDDRKAAAFITAKDPTVLEFSKSVASWTKGQGSRAVSSNLRMAIGLHEALRLYGLNYVIDPTTPFAEFSKEKLAVDFLQFPRQTLRYTSGDCDDLSILYSALLESVGIETAFITIPGHIFMAFSLDMAPDEARRQFLRPDELIFRNGKAWVPVEITKVQSNFSEAWQTGAKEWRENVAREQAVLYPMHESWKEYEPVGLPGGISKIDLPIKNKVVEAYLKECTRFIDREIYPRVSKLQADIRRSGNSSRYVNRLGVLYAKYGLEDKAVSQFNSILSKQEYVPALINMGNIFFLKKNMEKALEYYERASRQRPKNPKVLLCLARTHHELENYGMVRRSYDDLKALDSGLAEKFAYLDLRGEEADRAAELSEVEEVVIWDEE